MSEWIDTPHCIEQKRIVEVQGSIDESSYNSLYSRRYLTPLPDGDDLKARRYVDEVFSDMRDGASVLIVGSGHPELAKMIRVMCPKISKLGCVDRIEAAGVGLDSYNINFYKLDVLIHALPREYDYVFSSHTLEHFTRDELLGKVLPRMSDAALRSVYAVVPFKEAWASEPSHRCKFYKGDELFCASSKYRLIHNEQELVLKFE